MRTSREQFGDAGSFEALLDQSESSPETCSSCSDHNGVEGMVNDGVLLEESVLVIGQVLMRPWSRDWSLQLRSHRWAGT